MGALPPEPWLLRVAGADESHLVARDGRGHRVTRERVPAGAPGPALVGELLIRGNGAVRAEMLRREARAE
jgi:hypothetical protein